MEGTDTMTSEEVKPKFSFPIVPGNPSGWGPCDLPEQFKDVPYQPFSKADRVGKVADWSGSMYQDRRTANKYGNTYGQGGQQYAYRHEEDESSFQLVDTAKVKANTSHRRPKYNQQKIRRDREKREERRMGGKQQIAKGKLKERDRWRQQQHKRIKKFMRLGSHYDRSNQVPIKPRAPSVSVKHDWPVVSEIDFTQLGKLHLKPEEPTELRLCGSLGCYDIGMEKRVSLRNPTRLQTYNRIFHKVTTTDDPIIRKLVKSPECADVKVFGTDIILSTLMTCSRSKYSWDIVATRIGQHLFFDKRDDSQFDLLTVSETSKEPPQDVEDVKNPMNLPNNLAIEATYINQNFSQQILLEGPGRTVDLNEPNPFAGDEPEQIASVGYRYMKWDLGGGVGLVARCEYDAVMPYHGQKKVFINVKALNEWDPKQCGGVEWRMKLESQKGAVFATELKNNSFKIAKWAMSSLLAGSSFIKFGYVARRNPRDSNSHHIVGIQTVKPLELAQQTSLDVGNAWGVLRAIIDICFQQPYDPTKKLLILKDPNQQVIRFYSIPMDTFEETDDESSSSEEESSEDEEHEVN
ncbi:eukaryotic translation initiation factor 3 subunit D-like [Halichondria panicea]|uniref:eukaryotic translation initiation factor 3 subunit D-like n=1 Tax=Halichondria panicea TaxID=6063 RepID=UPI00312B7D5C